MRSQEVFGKSSSSNRRAGLEHADPVALLGQPQRGDDAAEAGADDEDVVVEGAPVAHVPRVCEPRLARHPGPVRPAPHPVRGPATGAHTGTMLSPELAVRLRAAGVRLAPAHRATPSWCPSSDLDDRVFVLSDMVVELVDVPGGTRVLAFNGTTEWALDSLEATAPCGCRVRTSCAACSGAPSVALERVSRDRRSLRGDVAVGGRRSRHVDVHRGGGVRPGAARAAGAVAGEPWPVAAARLASGGRLSAAGRAAA